MRTKSAEQAAQSLRDVFFKELESVNAKPAFATNPREAIESIRAVLERGDTRSVVMAGLPPPVRLLVEAAVKGFNHRDTQDPELLRDPARHIARADVGITWAEYAAARQGTLMEVVNDDASKLASSLPMTHIALCSSSRLLPSVSDLMAEAGKIVSSAGAATGRLPTISLITGPSKTGDIEMRLLYGVHGPNSLHVLLLDWI